MGGELVTADVSWLEVVKSAANAEHYKEDPLLSRTADSSWIDQLNDPNDLFENVGSDSFDHLKRLALKSDNVTRSACNEEHLLIKKLEEILHESDDEPKPKYLGLLRSYMLTLKVNQDDSTLSKERNGLVDGIEEESTLKLLEESCEEFGHRLISLILECSVAQSVWTVVKILLERRVVVSSSYSKLVQSLVEEEKPLLLCVYIANVPDVTPQDVHSMVTFFLDSISNPSKCFGPVKSEWRSVATQEIQKVVKNRPAKQAATSTSIFHDLDNLSRGYDTSISSAIGLAMAIDGFSSPELCIHHLLASRIDEAVLSSIIAQLSTVQVLQLTRYLSKWIERYSSHLGNFPTTKSGRVPSFAQVLSWVGVVLEGHFTQLVLSADFHKELKSMRQMVQSLVDFGANISHLGGITEHITSNSLLPTQIKRGGDRSDYVIELLDMS